MSRRSLDSTEVRKPLRLWEPPENAGGARFCIATTFTFDATFFENDCLGRFLEMETHGTESESVGYLIEREEKLRGLSVCVLVDRHHATSKESLLWDVLPVVVPGALLHAKVAVLAWENHLRVIVGSGNLTEPGYRQNVEVFGTLDLSSKAGGPKEQVLAVLSFLDEVLRRAVGDAAQQGPKQRAGKILTDVRRHVRTWPTSNPRGMTVVPVFTGLGKSVFEQLPPLGSASSRPLRADVLSPFFDRKPDQSDLIKQLVKQLRQRGVAGVVFYVAGEEREDGSIRLTAPHGLIDAVPDKFTRAVAWVPLEQADEARPLHAKMLELESDDCLVRMIGSSNFTSAGYGIDKPCNLEANLIYVVRAENLRNQFGIAWPDSKELDLDGDRIVWEPVVSVEDDGSAVAVIPRCFSEALFCPAPEPQLWLRFDEASKLPAEWSISLQGIGDLLTSVTWNQQSEHIIPWTGSPPFLLDVCWTNEVGQKHATGWPVNVTDPTALAPPDELRSLTLDELIQVLSSTRPLHEAVVRVLERRSRATQMDNSSSDPLRRFSNETFLVQRLKRVAVALERLRERLERPVAHADAFRWRLFGPVGPRALANAFRNEGQSMDEVRFFLAELALTLKRVQVTRLSAGGLSRPQARLLLRECIDEIVRTNAATGSPAHGQLGRYVKAALKEARS